MERPGAKPSASNAPDRASNAPDRATGDQGQAPGSDADVTARLEASLAGWRSVSRLIEQGLGPEDLVDRALGDMPHRVLEKRPLRFFCRCTRERALDLLASLKPADLAEIIADGQGAELSCQFCRETYRFAPEELARLARP